MKSTENQKQTNDSSLDTFSDQNGAFSYEEEIIEEEEEEIIEEEEIFEIEEEEEEKQEETEIIIRKSSEPPLKLIFPIISRNKILTFIFLIFIVLVLFIARNSYDHYLY